MAPKTPEQVAEFIRRPDVPEFVRKLFAMSDPDRQLDYYESAARGALANMKGRKARKIAQRILETVESIRTSPATGVAQRVNLGALGTQLALCLERQIQGEAGGRKPYKVKPGTSRSRALELIDEGRNDSQIRETLEKEGCRTSAGTLIDERQIRRWRLGKKRTLS